MQLWDETDVAKVHSQKIIAGHPSYKITKGEIIFAGQDIQSFEPEERAQSGIFLGFQYPIEIPGVSNLEFLRVATNARNFLKGRTRYF